MDFLIPALTYVFGFAGGAAFALTWVRHSSTAETAYEDNREIFHETHR